MGSDIIEEGLDFVGFFGGGYRLCAEGDAFGRGCFGGHGVDDSIVDFVDACIFGFVFWGA